MALRGPCLVDAVSVVAFAAVNGPVEARDQYSWERAVGALPERPPVSIGDPSLVTGSLLVCGMDDMFQLLLQHGRIAVRFLCGVPVVRYANITQKVSDRYEQPHVAPH